MDPHDQPWISELEGLHVTQSIGDSVSRHQEIFGPLLLEWDQPLLYLVAMDQIIHINDNTAP
jgi:hypothetical protein